MVKLAHEADVSSANVISSYTIILVLLWVSDVVEPNVSKTYTRYSKYIP